MKRTLSLMIFTICAGAAMAQSPPTQNWSHPESFTLLSASTSDSVKRLFALDNEGVYLTARFGKTDVLPFEIGIELVGHVNPRSSNLEFGVAQASNLNDALTLRIEQFNYVAQEWNVLLTVTPGTTTIGSDGNTRPYSAPFTSVQMISANYVSPNTGEVRTRVFWTSPRPFQMVWVDFAGWNAAQ